MRIGLVLHGLDRPLSGVTRVALELATALREGGLCELTFLTTYRDGPFRGTADRSSYLPGCERVPGLMVLGGPLISVTARRHRLDLVHDPVGVSPFTLGSWAGRFRRVVTIHDAIAFRDEAAFARTNAWLHRQFVPRTLVHVDRIITVSEHARADLEHFLPRAAGRISVVPNGVSEHFRPVPADLARRVARRHGIDGPYLLHVGVAQRRKNVETLIRAFHRLQPRFPELALVLGGGRPPPNHPRWRLIDELGLASKVYVLGPVPDRDLPALYSAASAFAFPSLYEGFGLPVLEAMSCGTPVVASNATSLPEVAGEAALLVEPRDVHALADALERAVSDTDLRARLRRLGMERAAAFTWDRAARATVAAYERTLAGLP